MHQKFENLDRATANLWSRLGLKNKNGKNKGENRGIPENGGRRREQHVIRLTQMRNPRHGKLAWGKLKAGQSQGAEGTYTVNGTKGLLKTTQRLVKQDVRRKLPKRIMKKRRIKD